MENRPDIRKATRKSPYEQHTGKEPNTIKKLFTTLGKPISDVPEFKLTETDFDSGQDSTILVKEREKEAVNWRELSKRERESC